MSHLNVLHDMHAAAVRQARLAEAERARMSREAAAIRPRRATISLRRYAGLALVRAGRRLQGVTQPVADCPAPTTA